MLKVKENIESKLLISKAGALRLTRRSERRYAELTHSLLARYDERGAQAKISVNERNVNMGNNLKAAVEVKIGSVTAKISAQLDKIAICFAATMSAIGTMITPEIKGPKAVEDKEKTYYTHD